MIRDPYDETHVVRSRRGGRWIALLVVVCVVGAIAWFIRESSSNRDLQTAGAQSDTPGTLRQPFNNETTGGTAAATGTSGKTGDAGASDTESGIIRELDTITGSVDGHELIGRRVNLTAPVRDKANDNAFWVGMGDNRMLVVLRRDHRDGVQRQQSDVAAHGIAPVHAGQTAVITGSIQKLPKAEDMFSWGLTAKDKKELAERQIYIRADTVTTEGHGE
jgi:hypothetical protein